MHSDYLPRLVDRQVKQYLAIFGALLLEGPKWCGKTWTARHHAKSTFDVSSPAGGFRNRQMANLQPDLALAGELPHLIDEWQEAPSLWDAVRYQVDQTGNPGQFILTGSSTPDDKATIHSGAGRYGRVRMHTMTLQEAGISSASVSLAGLFAGKAVKSDVGKLSFNDVAGLVCRGGWPALQTVPLEYAQESVRSYLETIGGVDISRIDGVRRAPSKVMALLQSLARNTATLVKKETLRKDIAAFSSTSLNTDTIGEYLNLLQRIFIVEEIPAWEPALKSTVRLRASKKQMLSDPSLAVAALGATTNSLMQDPKLLGNLFETLVLHDLLVYAQANNAHVYHYHDNSGLEIDAVVETRDGFWGGIEIKLGFMQEEEAAGSLLRLKKKLSQTQQKPPSFLAVIVGVGGFLKQRDDGVWVIPIDCLGA